MKQCEAPSQRITRRTLRHDSDRSDAQALGRVTREAVARSAGQRSADRAAAGSAKKKRKLLPKKRKPKRGPAASGSDTDDEEEFSRAHPPVPKIGAELEIKRKNGRRFRW